MKLSTTTIKRRLAFLWSMEAANAVIFPACLAFGFASAGIATDWPMWLAAVACVGLLVQGAAYWKLKFDSVCRGRDCFLLRAPLFHRLRRANPWWLGAVGLAVLAGRLVLPAHPAVVWASFGFFALAVLEHVNYFEWQLMHDTAADWRHLAKRGIRRSHLWHDLRRTM